MRRIFYTLLTVCVLVVNLLLLLSFMTLHSVKHHEKKKYYIKTANITRGIKLKRPSFKRIITEDNIYIYSAFYENNSIRIIGLMNHTINTDTTPLFCEFHTSGGFEIHLRSEIHIERIHSLLPEE